MQSDMMERFRGKQASLPPLLARMQWLETRRRGGPGARSEARVSAAVLAPVLRGLRRVRRLSLTSRAVEGAPRVSRAQLRANRQTTEIPVSFRAAGSSPGGVLAPRLGGSEKTSLDGFSQSRLHSVKGRC